MLKVEGLNAGYGSVNILWDIGFTLAEGEIVAILGSNGAGKRPWCGRSRECSNPLPDRWYLMGRTWRKRIPG